MTPPRPPATIKTPRPRGRYEHSFDNQRIVLTSEPVDEKSLDRIWRRRLIAASPQKSRAIMVLLSRLTTVPTADPADRAHGAMSNGMLLPAADEDGRPTRGLGAKPRRYHSHQMRGGVSYDSAFDSWAATTRSLEDAGITLGSRAMADAIEQGLAAITPAMARRSGLHRARDLVQQVTRTAMTPQEQELEAAGTRLLARASPKSFSRLPGSFLRAVL